MKSEAGRYLQKAIDQLNEASGCVKAGYSNAAGHFIYVAALNAAMAFVVERTGKIALKHKSANIMFASASRDEPKIPKEFHSILPQTYDLKKIADYELGPDAKIPLERAQAAIERVSRFIDCIRELL